MKIINQIDLTKCKKGDSLIGRNGAIMEYLSRNKESFHPILNHRIRYIVMRDGTKPKDSQGTRSDDGQTFLNNKHDTDEDIEFVDGQPFGIKERGFK